ncbi:MAG TPA: glycoside hydrolase domain-containing protein [Planctomycetota bacterium]|nr:glycoside hydrolase domain-containing protein [Planctomycetota bacterium]
MRKRAVMLSAVLAVALLMSTSPAAERVVLDTGSAWRLRETWSTDVARLDSGKLLRVNPYKPRQDLEYKDQVLVAKKYALREATRLEGSPSPPGDWREVTFDDARWSRLNGPFDGFTYRAIAQLSVRGRFEVTDPEKVGETSLAVVFQGGLAAYLNGKEIARSHLPAGMTGTVHVGTVPVDTLADDYPMETYATADGKLIQQGWYAGRNRVASYRVPKELYDEWVAGYRKRSRTLEVKVPATMLRKGTNVLALEVHRAPGAELMFAVVSQAGSFDRNTRSTYWWNRCELESVKLTAPDDAPGVTPNTDRPKTLRVRNCPVFHRVDPREWGDPLETLGPVRLVGVRNGTFSGKVVVSAVKPLANLRAECTDLAGPAGNRIDRSSIRVRFPRCEKLDRYHTMFDALDPAPDLTVERPGNTQPVWVTVRVPKDAAPGDYAGTLNLTVDPAGGAGDEEPVKVPVALKVIGWTLVDPQQFTTHVGIIQSPESVAEKHSVPMWSEKHWTLVERSFELMGRLGAKTIHIPVKCRTHFGNPHTMVRWVQQPDGTHKLDFTRVERYLDVATKHLGKVPVVCLAIYDGGPSNSRPDPPGTFVTEVNCATGKLQDLKAPDWGTPESREFWKPLLDGMRERLAKRGMEKSLMVGLAQGVAWECVQDLKAVAPDVPWVAHSHLYHETFGERHGMTGQPVEYLAQVGGLFSVFWDPEDGRPFYGWRNPQRMVTYPRDDTGAGVGPCLRVTSGLPVYRLGAEGSILSGRQDRYPHKWGARAESMALQHGRSFPGLRGFGRLGADFWPVLESKTQTYPLCGRYPGSDWGTLSLKWVVPYLFGAGRDGAVETIRSEMLLEGLQEAEARIFVQDALLDDDVRAKLPAALAARLEKLTTERTRALRYISEFYGSGNIDLLLEPTWQDASEELYRAAAEVAKTLGR